MKRGVIEEITIIHIFLTSSVCSVPLPPEYKYWCLHIPFCLHQTFYPWSSKEATENVLRNAQKFLLIHPRGVSPVSCWVGGRNFAHCGTSSFSLTFKVGSSMTVVAHFVHSAHTPEHKGAPILWVMRRSQFWWRTCEHPVHWFFTRYEGIP